ncbi:MAG: N-acetyltransferase family protein [Acidimicrobiales bacterium]|jgi:phosphinothricin acetyltransferase|nr:N-acetyltransferase family protein [Acidimicrobiales bacterium]HJM29261.1 N-acetyltransferase family protein [Acidimicrobiales bacterium]HJM96557.1 N-acetyltransferase family protein [Acidimicrobiales bacterium]
MEIRIAQIGDAESIREIYNNEVTSGTATFDLTPRTLEEQREWLSERSGAHVVLIAESQGEVIGFGSLSRYQRRPAYSTTVEDSVYVRPDKQGQGVGLSILDALIEKASEHGFHTVIARISGESDGSIATHTKAGFKEVGRERETGRKFGRWLDVVVMQRFVDSS